MPRGPRLKPIPGFESLYAVDRHGNVYSLRRFVAQRNGCQRLQRQTKLTPTPSQGRNSTYLKVTLRKAGRSHTKYVHLLMLVTWVGPKPFPGAHGRHLDNNSVNNVRSNLAWGTQGQNERDKRKRKARRQTANPAALGYTPPF